MSIIVKEPEKKKPTPWAKYAWVQETQDNYTLRINSGFLARVYRDVTQWKTAVKVKDAIDREAHTDLEIASKYVDRLLYKTYPKVWTVTDARAIIAPWKGDLNCQ